MVTCYHGTDLNCGIISWEKTFLIKGHESLQVLILDTPFVNSIAWGGDSAAVHDILETPAED